MLPRMLASTARRAAAAVARAPVAAACGGAGAAAPAPARALHVHEYISMGLMKKFGVPVPKGEVATTPAEAQAIASKMLGGPCGALRALLPARRA